MRYVPPVFNYYINVTDEVYEATLNAKVEIIITSDEFEDYDVTNFTTIDMPDEYIYYVRFPEK